MERKNTKFTLELSPESLKPKKEIISASPIVDSVLSRNKYREINFNDIVTRGRSSTIHQRKLFSF